MAKSSFDYRRLGYLGMAGGALALLLAPIMVIIKYMTGWAIIPEPFWVESAQRALGGLLELTTPPELWTIYGSFYTLALLLVLAGLIGLVVRVRQAEGRVPTKGLWLVLIGLCMVIPGDAIHSWTWHQNGLTTPTPGTNPVANTAYAVHMMGMNFVMVGSIWVGIAALRRKFFAPWLAWCFLSIFPSALLASVALLPTTPSGALWLFSILVMVSGYFLATGQVDRLTPPERPLQPSTAAG
ncbi:MAG: hypothetical protein MI919_24335 [Holophagales bacterium]|nr:hypothetical protein [Holophagales bacterium]